MATHGYYTIAQVITWAKITGYLSQCDIARKNALNGGIVDERHPRLLYVSHKSLEYLYEQDPTNEDIYSIGDYVLALCGGYLAQAQNIAAIGGGGTIVNPTTKDAASIEGFRIELPITQSSTPVAGATSYVVNIAGIVEGSIDVKLPQGNIPQGIETDQFSCIVSYAPTAATITFYNIFGSTNLGLQDGMLIIITGDKFIAV